MRGVLVGALILVLMIALMVSYYFFANKNTNAMLQDIERVQTMATEGRWDDAMQGIEELSEMWEKNSVWMAGFVLHGEIDNISLIISSAYEYAKYQEESEMMRELAVLGVIIQGLIKNEHLLLENLL